MPGTPRPPLEPPPVAAAEGERWAGTVEQLRGNYQMLTGDMLLAAAFISYAGPFSSKFRWAVCMLLQKGWSG